MNAAQRARRRHDLLLAADVLRREIDAGLTMFEPAAERALFWTAIGVRLRRRYRASGDQLSGLLTATGGVIGIGWFALRHWRWISKLWLAWQSRKPARR
jgi:hypothetical protein